MLYLSHAGKLVLTHMKVIFIVAPPLEAGHPSETALPALGSTASEHMLLCLSAVWLFPPSLLWGVLSVLF